MRVLVTGAAGFIGRHLVKQLSFMGDSIRACTSDETADFGPKIEVAVVRNLDWHDCVVGMDAIVHLAGRAHVLREQTADPLTEFTRVNVQASIELGKQAIEAGVKRFVFVSSIGVNGVRTCGVPFTEEQQPNPIEPYAISKWQAEQALRELSARSGLELTIVRPPLVYGAGVKGNFLRLLNLVRSGLPLPLGSIENSRSYVGVENLCDALSLCVRAPSAAGELFLLADGEDVSTPALIALLSRHMGRPTRVVRFPRRLLDVMATLVRRRAEVERLADSLQVDSSRIRNVLGWIPRQSFDEGIAAMVAWFLSQADG